MRKRVPSKLVASLFKSIMGKVIVTGTLALPVGAVENMEEPRIPERDNELIVIERDRYMFINAFLRQQNFDEKKVVSYTLPPLFTSANGSRAEWENYRRSEILRLFEEHVYGKIPPAPDCLELELLNQKDDALNGLAIRKEMRLHCRMKNGRHFDFDLLLYIPKKVVRPPVWVALNFSGNQYNTPEKDVRLSRGTTEGAGRWFATEPIADTERCKKLPFMNYEQAIRHGYAVATACYGEIFPDNPYGIEKSIYTLFYSSEEIKRFRRYHSPFDTKSMRPAGAITAWAWGMSRILDALEKEPLVDASRVALIGHSRLGKTALWAGANDTRFKVVVANNSGCTGAALSRRNFGESIYKLAIIRDYWYCERFLEYSVDMAKLPVDQHMLIALNAPRAVYVASSSLDNSADPRGEFLGLQAAAPVWELYGKRPEMPQNWPAVDRSVGNAIRYHVKTGGHSLVAWDWEQYYQFADQVFSQMKK